MKEDQRYMLRCLQLGKKALGTAAPNPAVGCVIVHNNKVIGEGYTRPYGGSHAEVNAIGAVRDKSLLPDATLYVTLEPCAHYGKTPPCVNLILEHRIPRVVIGLQDPHPKVAGRGIEKLRAAGCSVSLGMLEAACREHHKRFLCFQEKQRPYMILKWAQTRDGFIAPPKAQRPPDAEPFWITDPYSRQLVHQWRSQEQAILVGTRTVLEDNPKLTVRDWAGPSPLRIVIDRDLKIPPGFHVMDATTPTLVLTAVQDPARYRAGIAYENPDFSKPLAAQITALLYQRAITSLLVEGGAQTLQTFIREGLWDEARIFTGAAFFGAGVPAPKICGTLKQKNLILADILSILSHD